jgi:hypothetical protein
LCGSRQGTRSKTDGEQVGVKGEGGVEEDDRRGGQEEKKQNKNDKNKGEGSNEKNKVEKRKR